MGLEHIETKEVVNENYISFTEVFDNSADRYVLYVDNMIPDGFGRLHGRVSTDGANADPNGRGGWDTTDGNYVSSYHYVSDDGLTVADSIGESDRIRRFIDSLSDDVASNHTAMCKITIHDPYNPNRATVMRTKASFYTGSFETQFQGAQHLVQDSVDSIQLALGGGSTMTKSATCSLYKVTQTTGGAKQHIETIEANSQSSVDFTNVFDADDGYDRYEIYADNVIPSEDASQLQSRFSSDSGSTFDSGSSDYAHSIFTVDERGETLSSGSSSDNAIDNIIASIGNDESENDTSTANILISEPTNANRSTVLRSSSSRYGNSFSGPFGSSYSGGIRLTQSAIDSIQFFMSSGDIASGTFSVYGIGE